MSAEVVAILRIALQALRREESQRRAIDHLREARTTLPAGAPPAEQLVREDRE